MSPRTTYLITGADRGLGPALLATYLTRPNTTVNHPQYAPQYGNLERQLTKQDRRKVQNRNAQRNYRKNVKERANNRKKMPSMMSSLPLEALQSSKSKTIELGVQPQMFDISSTDMASFEMSGEFDHRSMDFGRDFMDHGYGSSSPSSPWVQSILGQDNELDQQECKSRGMAYPSLSVSPASSTVMDFSGNGQDVSLLTGANSSDQGASDFLKSLPTYTNTHEAQEYQADKLSSHNRQNTTTTLHIASQNGHEAAVRFLLEHGADVDAVDVSRQTSLHLAVTNGHLGVAKLLLENDASIDVTDTSGRAALHRAAEVGNEAILRLLVEYGADLHQGIEEP